MAATAGAMESDGYENANHGLIKAWIVDYFCRLCWKEFQSLGRLDTLWMVVFARDVCASPNIARPPPSSDDDQEKEEGASDYCDRLLIRLMFYLTDCTEILTGEKERKDLCRLEHAMRAFERLVRLEYVRNQLDDGDLKKMRILLKEQSVLECWRSGDIDMARAVCDRQYQYFEDCDIQKLLDKLHRALLQRNTDVLSNMSPYSELIDFSKEVLKKVFDVMNPPALVALERRFFQYRREDEDDVDLQPSTSLSQLPDEEQDRRTDTEGGAGIKGPDPDPVQPPSPKKKRPSSSSAAECAQRESVIEVRSADSDSDEESEGERPAKKIRESSSDSDESSERKKGKASTSKAVDNERDFDLYFDSPDEEHQWSHSKKQRRVWTPDEERDVYLGVKSYGVGNWRKVAQLVGTGRSNVDVKDKWRNMAKQGKIQEFRDLYGPI